MPRWGGQAPRAHRGGHHSSHPWHSWSLNTLPHTGHRSLTI
jgi:hypothetical protein